MAAISFSCALVDGLEVAPPGMSVSNACMSACGAACAGKNSAIRSAVAANVVTLSILVLANIEHILTGRVLRKNLRRAESVLSKFKPKAFKSSRALVKKAEGFWLPSDCDLKYLLNTSDFGCCPNVRMSPLRFSYGVCTSEALLVWIDLDV